MMHNLALMMVCLNLLSVAGVYSEGGLRAQINDIPDGGTIHVPAGVYSENIVINKNLTLVGTGIENTIVDGRGKGSVFAITPNGNKKVSVTFKDMTIRNGKVRYGAGIDCMPNTSISVYKCKLADNNASGDGGAIELSADTDAIISGCEISNNTAAMGAGINSFSKNLDISFTEIVGNKARYDGGGIYYYGDACSINGCKINSNIARTGGAVNNWGHMEIGDCLIANNYATRYGGGICNEIGGFCNERFCFANENEGCNGDERRAETARKAGTLIINPGVMLVNNTAKDFAGGICNGMFGTMTAIGPTLERNTASERGSAIYNECNLTLIGGEIKNNKALTGGSIWNIKNMTMIGVNIVEG
jgi:hypothetical protein